MGCLSDSKTVAGGGAGNSGVPAAFQKVSVKLEKLMAKRAASAAFQKLSAKLEELIAKRDAQTPRVIAKGNYCSNPCYEFNLNLISKCPKCKGKVVMEYENEFTIKKEYDSDGREFEKKIYNNKACDEFEYDDSISISNEDIYFDLLCIYIFQFKRK